MRPFEEFNITAYHWSYLNWGGAKFQAAWQHVYDRFQLEGATNVKFVWNFAGDSQRLRVGPSPVLPG